MIKSSEEWRKEFTELGCIRVYGESCKEHAALAHGVHSDTITDCWPFLSSPARVRAACTDLISILKSFWAEHPTLDTHVDRFIGPPVSGWPIAYELAGMRGVKWVVARENLLHTAPSAVQRGVGRADVSTDEEAEYFSFEGASLQSRDVSVIADDIALTGREISMTIDAAQRIGVIVANPVLVLINRLRPNEWTPGEVTHPRSLVHMRSVRALFDLEARYWPDNNCALCTEGSSPSRRKVKWSVRTQS